jgi:hypothetical protein
MLTRWSGSQVSIGAAAVSETLSEWTASTKRELCLSGTEIRGWSQQIASGLFNLGGGR